MTTQKGNSVFFMVYEIVMQIPKGKVFTYGAISKLINGRLSAQGVGWALNALPERPKKLSDDSPKFHSGNVPWHRVINAKGQTSTSKRPDMPEDRQRRMLESEGVIFSADAVDLDKYLWTGPRAKRS
ncbi:MAG: MGMT family protein [Candidatus Obscuribacterales bacterium]|jgi:methylated-DNA-protein-cysteine methyltransferase-like protein|nr:MGMT family protein [Candidatus Obscuribacterales bacterium]